VAELSSSQKISSNSSGINGIGINIKNQNSNPRQTQLNARGSGNPAGVKNPVRVSSSYEDIFSSKNLSEKLPEQKAINNSFLRQSAQIIGNVRGNFAKISATVKTGGISVINSFNKVQVGTQQLINNFLSRFVDISDKISAVYGEKEKDIRENLSDTFNRIVKKVYDPLAPVDTEFKHEDSNKEKQTKDRDEELPEKNAHSKTHRID